MQQWHCLRSLVSFALLPSLGSCALAGCEGIERIPVPLVEARRTPAFPSTLAPGVGLALDDNPRDAGAFEAGEASEQLPPLPVATSNQAVAGMVRDGICEIYSIGGITGLLRRGDIVSAAYRLRVGASAGWERVADLPLSAPVVAANAVTVGGQVYFLGGYAVSLAPGAAETTSGRLLSLRSGSWVDLPAMPLAVDDAVALPLRDRFIAVISGWSSALPVAGNTDAVQLFDTQENRWLPTTRWPGRPIFGGVGAVSRDELLIVDGVAVEARAFKLVAQAWVGRFDPSATGPSIRWTNLGGHPGPPRYRAAAGRATSGVALIAGGGLDAYNYDGLSYESGAPVLAASTLLSFDFTSRRFATRASPPSLVSMDHRGVAECGDARYVVGGLEFPATPMATLRRLPSVSP